MKGRFIGLLAAAALAAHGQPPEGKAAADPTPPDRSGTWFSRLFEKSPRTPVAARPPAKSESRPVSGAPPTSPREQGSWFSRLFAPPHRARPATAAGEPAIQKDSEQGTWFSRLFSRPDRADRPAAPAATATAPYQESQRRGSWFSQLFVRPAKKTPEEQLAHARALRSDGRPRSAARAYRALVATWPASSAAVAALQEWAQMLESRGDWEGAFEQYQQLIDRYPSQIDFAAVLARQAAIADRIAARRSIPWLFGGFTTPERALPMYEQVLTNAPNWERAADIALTAARILERNGDLAAAASAFADVRFRYPSTRQAEEAAARRAECLWRLAERAPNNTAVLDEAWNAAADFLASFPASRQAPVIRLRHDVLFRRRAKAAYEAALFYDRRQFSTEVTRAAYERFLAQFPASPWTPVVRRRLAELGPVKEPTS